MDGFTEVYDTRTGVKHRVPRDWVGHPVLGRFIKVTPQQREADGVAEAARVEAEEAAAAAAEDETAVVDEEPTETVPVERPEESWTGERIKAYAHGADIDLSGAKASKAEMVARINEVLDAPVEVHDPDQPSGDDVASDEGEGG